MERTRRSWIIWPAIALASTFVYLASFVPLTYVITHGYIDPKNTWVGAALGVYYSPIRLAYVHGPEPVQQALKAYREFLEKL